MVRAVEGAFERVGLAAPRHGRYADVVSQLDVLSAVVASEADVVGEAFPLLGIADDVWVGRRACALRGPVRPDGRNI